MRRTGKSERRANVIFIAGNNFHTSFVDREDESREEDDSREDDDEDSFTNTGKKRRIRGRSKVLYLDTTLDAKLTELVTAVTELGPEEYRKRRASIEKGIKVETNTFLGQRQSENLLMLYYRLDILRHKVSFTHVTHKGRHHYYSMVLF